MVEWSGEFAYQQVANDLRRRIAAEEFSESRQLPSLGQLQKTYGVTVTVARAAINQLKTEGLLISHQGKGVFLTSDADQTAKSSGPSVSELRREVEALRREVEELRLRVAGLEDN